MPLPMQPQCGNKGLIRARLPSEELNLRQKWNERKQKKKKLQTFSTDKTVLYLSQLKPNMVLIETETPLIRLEPGN